MPTDPTYVPHMTPTLMTADELRHVYIPDKRVELVRGALVVRELPGFRHGRASARLIARLVTHIEAAGATQVVVSEVGFRLATDPDTVRGPDVAVVSSERVADPEPPAFLDIAPDLVVEVVSPRDRPGAVLGKVAEWLSAGTKLVWVLDPARRAARVYRADGTEQVLAAHESLDGEAVVPGFNCPLDAIL